MRFNFGCCLGASVWSVLLSGMWQSDVSEAHGQTFGLAFFKTCRVFAKTKGEAISQGYRGL